MDMPPAQPKAHGGLYRGQAFMEQGEDDDLGFGVKTRILKHPVSKRVERPISREMRERCRGTGHFTTQ